MSSTAAPSQRSERNGHGVPAEAQRVAVFIRAVNQPLTKRRLQPTAEKRLGSVSAACLFNKAASLA